MSLITSIYGEAFPWDGRVCQRVEKELLVQEFRGTASTVIVSVTVETVDSQYVFGWGLADWFLPEGFA